MYCVTSNYTRLNIGYKRTFSNKNGVSVAKGRNYIGYKYNNNKGKNRIHVNECTVH